MKKKLYFKSPLLYIASFLLPFAIIIVGFSMLHITPFGDNSIVVADADGLYINYLGYASRLFGGLEGFLYSFEKGLGGNMMPHMAGTMINPFFPVFNLFNVVDYTTAFTWVSLLNISACGLTMYVLLANVFDNRRSNLIFSTSYAISGFLVANVFQVIFFTGPMMLPLMVLGLRMIFQGKNPIVYFLSLTFCILTNTYFGFTLCVFSALLFFTILWLRREEFKGMKLALFVHYGLVSICAGLIPIAMWLPALMGIKGGRLDQTGIGDFSFWERMPFIEIFTKLFTGANTVAQLMDGLPNIYVGLLPVFLVVLFFLNKKVSKRTKAAAGVLLIFYMLGFYIMAFDMLLHAGTITNWFNFRYSYIFSFLLIMIAAYEWQYLDELSFYDLKRCFIGIVIAVIIIFSKRYEHVMGSEVILDFALLLVIFFAFHIYRTKPKENPKHLFEIIIIMVVSIGLLLNFVICTSNIMKGDIKESEFQETVGSVNVLVKAIQGGDTDFYRMEVNKQRSNTAGNDPMLYGYNGVGHGGSNERDFVRIELSKLGVQWYDMRNYYAQGIPAATDALLGIKYLIANEDVTEEKNYIRITDMQKMGLVIGDEVYDAYKSTTALPIGFVSDESVNLLELNHDNIFENLNRVWGAISGSEQVVFVDEDEITFRTINLIDTEEMDAKEARNIVDKYENISKRSIADSATPNKEEVLESNIGIYKSYGTSLDTASDDGTTVDHSIMDKMPIYASSVEFSFTAKKDGPVYIYHGAALSSTRGSDDKVVRYMGWYHKGDIVRGYLPVEDEYVDRITFEEFAGRLRAAYADLDALQEMSDVVTSRPSTIEKIKDSHLKGTLKAEEGQELLFTIPWDTGWTCYIDGQRVELTKVLGVFMAAQVEPGEHTFEMIFEPEGLHIGLLISFATLGVFILYLLFGHKWIDSLSDKMKDKDRVEENVVENTHPISVQRIHYYGLDFVKVIATILIVLHHYQLSHQVYFENGINFYYGKFYFGWIVELFFVISGFVMWESIEKIKLERFGGFIAQKYLRFQPMMLISVLCTTLLMFLFETSYQLPWDGLIIDFFNVLISALGFHALTNTVLINNPLWYVSVLLVCYMLMYAQVHASNRLSWNPTPLFVVTMIAGIFLFNVGINTILLNTRTARGLYAFFWGLVLASIVKRMKSSRTITVLAGLIVVCFPFVIAFTNISLSSWINYVMTFGYYSAVVFLFTSDDMQRVFSGKIWGTLAGISYNIYVWHPPMFILYAVFFFLVGSTPDFSNIGTLVLMILGICAVGALSYRFVDIPFRKFFIRRPLTIERRGV